MDSDEKERIAAGEVGAAQTPPVRVATPGSNARHWVRSIVLLVIFLPLLGMAAWTAITLNYTYSHGNRAGYIQKFSQKGWLCKTWEGEIAISNVPGQLQEKFEFTVRSDSVAAEVQKHMGGRVSITYDQHPGVPGSCFGDTPYFVTGVQPVQ